MLKMCLTAGKCLLLESAKQLLAYQPGSLPGVECVAITTTDAINQLLAAKSAANRRSVYIKSLRHYLTRFASGRENKPLAEIKAGEIEDWLKQFKSAYSRQTWLNRISTLFAFAVRRGVISINPCKQIERIIVDRPPPQILSPGQSQLLLDLADKGFNGAGPKTVKPYLVLAMYAGIRPEEILKIDRSQIDLKTATVRVNDTKTRRRRIVTLEPRAVTLLADCLPTEGPVAPANITVRRFKRFARQALNMDEWPKDVLRHTAASYLLARHNDVAKVAMMLGNSPGILMTHYHEPVRESDAVGFWHEWPRVEPEPKTL